MPELPEVETTVRGLRPILDGHRIESIDLRRADLRWPFPPDLRQRVTGAVVTTNDWGSVAVDRYASSGMR